MTADPRTDQARVGRLLRCYPAVWRARYGEELAALLMDEIDDEPRSWRRTLDVARSGLVARLSLVGLGAGPVSQARAALGTIVVASVGFVGCGVSLWSQLALGSGQAPLDDPAAAAGLVVLSVTIAFTAVVAALAAAPMVVAVAATLRNDRGRLLRLPLLCLAASAAVLVVGSHLAAGAGWGAPGATAGSGRLTGDGLAAAARAGWGVSLGLSAYWIHPHDLAGLPRLELFWMGLSLATIGAGVAAAVTVVRRVELSDHALRFQARLARIGALGLLPGLAAAGWWVLSSAGGPPGVYRAGSLDVLMIAAMAAALALAATAARQLRPDVRAART